MKFLVKTIMAFCLLVFIGSYVNAAKMPQRTDWIYIGEYYGDIYHYKYNARDDHEHCYLVWLRKELPGKDVVPANGFRKIRYQLLGIDVQKRVYCVYESTWETRDGKRVGDNEHWDSNWRLIRYEELDRIVDDLKDRGYR